MSRSTRPRYRELRQLYLLVGECCEVGADPVVWRERALRGLSKIVGAAVSFTTESGHVAIAEDEIPPRALWSVGVGWPCQRDRELFDQAARDRAYSASANPVVNAIRLPKDRVHVMRRVEVVADRDWYSSVVFDRYMRHANLDDGLAATFFADEVVEQLVQLRALHEPRWGVRQRRLVQLFSLEINDLLGTKLSTFTETSPIELSRRERETILLLADGKSVKQVASSLDISPNTTNVYVKRMKKKLQVSTQMELLRKVLPYIEAMKDRDRRIGRGSFASDMSVGQIQIRANKNGKPGSTVKVFDWT